MLREPRQVLATGLAQVSKSPLDLYPKTATVSLTLPAAIGWKGGSVTIEPGGSLPGDNPDEQSCATQLRRMHVSN